MENKEQELYDQALIVATEDIDGMDDGEVADFLNDNGGLGIEPNEINYLYRNDAITKRVDYLIDLWRKEGFA
jgi:hypothetical protein